MSKAEWKQIEPDPKPPEATYRIDGPNGTATVQEADCNGKACWWLYVTHSKGVFVPRDIGGAVPFKEALDHAILQTTAFLAWLKAQQGDDHGNE